LIVIGQFLTLTASSILLLLIVDHASQSNVRRIVDCDWSISYSFFLNLTPHIVDAA